MSRPEPIVGVIALMVAVPAAVVGAAFTKIDEQRITGPRGATMSYSRWGGSHWYTFWCVADENVVENRDNAKLEVMLTISLTAKEIREDLDGCLDRAKTADMKRTDSWGSGQKADESDMKELREIMQEFLADVDAQYLE